MSKKLTKQEFIQKSNLLHKSKYNYDDFIYNDNKTKGKIKCNICNTIFDQTPNNHLKGKGCPRCKAIKTGLDKKSNTEDFIPKAKAIHGNKFGYNKTNYLNAITKICVTCLIDDHGDFWITPNSHLNGRGCPKCKAVKISNCSRFTQEEIIKKFIEVHGNRYIYSDLKYLGIFIKIKIICPKHGVFSQTPHNHINGQGCPSCNSSKGEIKIKAILDKYNIKNESEYKLPEVVTQYEYDFYLPEYRILIEFHGIQHYEPIEFFGGEDNLSYIRGNDEIKKHLADRYKYRLLEFNYKQFKFMSEQQFEELVINNINKYKKLHVNT